MRRRILVGFGLLELISLSIIQSNPIERERERERNLTNGCEKKKRERERECGEANVKNGSFMYSEGNVFSFLLSLFSFFFIFIKFFF